MKASAVAGRGAARDFWDLHALMEAEGMTVAEALGVFRSKYVHEDVGYVVRSLVYFGDSEAEAMPRGMTPAVWAAIRGAFEAWVRAM